MCWFGLLFKSWPSLITQHERLIWNLQNLYEGNSSQTVPWGFRRGTVKTMKYAYECLDLCQGPHTYFRCCSCYFLSTLKRRIVIKSDKVFFFKHGPYQSYYTLTLKIVNMAMFSIFNRYFKLSGIQCWPPRSKNIFRSFKWTVWLCCAAAHNPTRQLVRLFSSLLFQ